MSIESFGPTGAAVGGGFFVGVLIGYALKKVIKLVAVIVIPGISNWSSRDGPVEAAASLLATTSIGIPLTGSMSAGFTIGCIRG
jgi:hypothetical protein